MDQTLADYGLPLSPLTVAGMLAVSFLSILLGRPLILRAGGVGKQVGVAFVAIGILVSLAGLAYIGSFGVAWPGVLTNSSAIEPREFSYDALASIGWVAVLVLGWIFSVRFDPR